MSNDKICVICKYYGRITWGSHRDTIFQSRQTHTLFLCYLHSVDLFKAGQTNFLAKYKHVFSDFDFFTDSSFSDTKDQFFNFSGFK